MEVCFAYLPFIFRFSNLTYGNEVPDGQARQEFSAVHIVERGSGLGIDNPGFDSPADLNLKSEADLKHSTIDWSLTDQIEVCEGSSTPTRSRTSLLVDSAYHEASIVS